MSTQNRQPRGVPTGGQFAASAKGEPHLALGQASPHAQWVPSPEDPDVLWASVPDGRGGEFALDMPPLDSHVGTSSDYDVPHRIERWGWTVRSGDAEREIASGVATNQATAAMAAVSAAQAATEATTEAAAVPQWLSRDQSGRYSTRDGYRVTTTRSTRDGQARTVHEVRDNDFRPIGVVTQLSEAAQVIERHRAGRGPVAPEVSDARVHPFEHVTDLRALARHYETVASPENISWDGERGSAATQAAYHGLGEAYRLRHAQIDPDGAHAYCDDCHLVVGADAKGLPGAHDNAAGATCPGGA